MRLLLPLQAKPSITAQLVLLFVVKRGSGTHWPGCPSAFPWDPGKPALRRCQRLAPSLFARPVNAAGRYILCSLRKWQFCWRSGFVKQTPFFFFFFSLFWGFFSLPSPSSPYTFPGPHPRTTLVPFSPTEGTKNFFYRPTGCSGYKEVKLTMRRCNSPLQAGLDEYRNKE